MRHASIRSRHGGRGLGQPAVGLRRVKLLHLSVRTVVALGLTAAAIASQAGVVAPELERAMAARGTHADTAVIVRFAGALDPQSLAVTDRRARDNRLLLALKARAMGNRAAIAPFLAAQDIARVKDLWIINGLAATLSALAVKQLAMQPSVERIDADSSVQGGRAQLASAPSTPRVDALPPAVGAAGAVLSHAAAALRRASPGWNVAAVHAPELWALGHTGKGVVVGTMDTGVDLAHPDLRRSWRGGTNSWFDPHGEAAAPFDALGHGTQAMGVIVGDAGLGVAPDARWIAVKLYNAAGRSRISDIHLAFQWLMDPDGDPSTVDSPDIVNASWTLSGRGAGACILEFDTDIRALRSTGIAVVFAAGNDGPAPGTSNSPGNNPDVLSVGAVDQDFAIARQTSRGPSACDGAMFPSLVAPGSSVRTADVSHGGLSSYATVSGSSLAAPHVAGVMALLAGAFPAASVDELENALLVGARHLGPAAADNTHGHGLADALGAFKALQVSRQSAVLNQR